jgi:hypothetical protein
VLDHRVARFRQIDQCQPTRHHETPEFLTERSSSLTHLCKAQGATMLQLAAIASVKVEDTKRHASLVVWIVEGLRASEATRSDVT